MEWWVMSTYLIFLSAKWYLLLRGECLWLSPRWVSINTLMNSSQSVGFCDFERRSGLFCTSCCTVDPPKRPFNRQEPCEAFLVFFKYFVLLSDFFLNTIIPDHRNQIHGPLRLFLFIGIRSPMVLLKTRKGSLVSSRQAIYYIVLIVLVFEKVT